MGSAAGKPRAGRSWTTRSRPLEGATPNGANAPLRLQRGHPHQIRKESAMRIASNDAGWTTEVIQRLSILWAEGHSTAEIGRRMGFSKNAIVGKAHRLNLPARPSPIQKDKAQPRPAKRPPCPKLPSLRCLAETSTAPPTARFVPPAPKRPRQLCCPPPRIGTDRCCWPLGEPGEPGFRFCGDLAITNKPYCPEHARIAYQPGRRRASDDEPTAPPKAGHPQSLHRVTADLRTHG